MEDHRVDQRSDESLRNVIWEWKGHRADVYFKDMMRVCVTSFGNGKATELMFTLKKHDESLCTFRN